MDERTRRIGANETLFREVNEQLDAIGARSGGDERFNIVCECGDGACTQMIPISAGEYEALRSDALRFAVVPGHELTDVEEVVDTRAEFTVVQKHDGLPSAIAEAADPRR